MQGPKVILFDLDGVVNNSKYFSLIYAEKFNVPLEKVQEVFEDGRKDLTNIGKADLKEVMSEVLDEWKWKGTLDELLDLWFKTDLNVDLEVIEEIKKLRDSGIKCYLATDQEKYRTKYLFEEMKFNEYFDGRFVSCEVGFVKHDKEFFEIAIKNLNLLPKEILYIDDSQSKLDTAKQTGIETFLYVGIESLHSLLSSFEHF